MATLYISEYQTSGWTTAGGLPCGQEPCVADQTVPIASGAAPSQPFNGATRFIRVHTDVICSIKIGPTGTAATTTNKRMAAGQTEYFGVTSGNILSVLLNN